MRIQVTIQGIRPLILHNGRTSDPLDEYAKKLKKVSSVRSKTDEHHKEMSDIEFLAGLYWSDELGVYMPADNLQAMLLAAARRLKLGRKIPGALVDEEYGVSIKAENSKDLDAISSDPNWRLRKAVTVNRAKVMRTRPMVPTGWGMTFHLDIDETVIREDEVIDVLHVAGKAIGLGDWRPGAPTPGTFGRFVVKETKKVN